MGERNERMDVGTYDARNTAEEWVDIINAINDPAMAFLIAEALSNKDLVRKEDEKSADGNVVMNMRRGELVQYALEKYLKLSGSVNGLFDKIMNTKGSDLLILKLEAIDLVIKRMKMEEVQYTHIFLNAYRNFLPWELHKIKIKEVYEAMIALEATQQVRVLSKGIIES